MNLLAIDTSFERCSVGVAVAGEPAAMLSETIGRGHAERMFGMISAATAEAGLPLAGIDRIAVTIGPGSFTGLRVGIAAARGLALVVGCPVAGIGALDAVAAAARAVAGPLPVLAALDARRGEVYAQAFDASGAPLSEPAAGPAEDFAALASEGMALAGSGAPLVAAAMAGAPRIVHREASPDIAAVLRLGLAAPAPSGPPRPLYIRPPDAKPQSAAVARR